MKFSIVTLAISLLAMATVALAGGGGMGGGGGQAGQPTAAQNGGIAGPPQTTTYSGGRSVTTTTYNDGSHVSNWSEANGNGTVTQGTGYHNAQTGVRESMVSNVSGNGGNSGTPGFPGSPGGPGNPGGVGGSACGSCRLPDLVVDNITFTDNSTGIVYDRFSVPQGVDLVPNVTVQNNGVRTNGRITIDHTSEVGGNSGGTVTVSDNYDVWDNKNGNNNGRYPVSLQIAALSLPNTRNNQGPTTGSGGQTVVNFPSVNFPNPGTFNANIRVDDNQVCTGRFPEPIGSVPRYGGGDNNSNSRGCILEDYTFETESTGASFPRTANSVRVGAGSESNNNRNLNVTVIAAGPPPPPPAPPAPECDDGINNDGAEDILIDFPADPGCSGLLDNSETDNPTGPVTECSDNVDNDGDGVRDAFDPGCWTNPIDPYSYDETDTDEIDPPGGEVTIAVDKHYFRPGETIRVTWDPGNFTGTSDCVLSENISGDAGFSGNADQNESYDDSPTSETTYELVCDNGSFSDSSSVKIYKLPEIQET